MSRVEGKRVLIDRPVEAVWSFMTDISNMPRWEDSHADEFEPNRKFAVEATTGRAKGTRISYFFEPVEGGKARLSRVTEVELDGLARLLQPLLAPIARWTGGMEADDVKRILESHHMQSR
jgi:hypothetical protein